MARVYRGNIRYIVAGYILPFGLLLYLATRFFLWPRFLSWLSKSEPDVAAALPPLYLIFLITLAVILIVLKWHTSRRYIRLDDDSLRYRDDNRSLAIPYDSIDHIQRTGFTPPGTRESITTYRVKSSSHEIAFGSLGVFALRDYYTPEREGVLILDILKSGKLCDEIAGESNLEPYTDFGWIRRGHTPAFTRVEAEEEAAREYPVTLKMISLGFLIAAVTFLCGAGVLATRFPLQFDLPVGAESLTFGYSVAGFLSHYLAGFAFPLVFLAGFAIVQQLVRKKELYTILAVSYMVICLLFHLVPGFATAYGTGHSPETRVSLNSNGITWKEWVRGEEYDEVFIPWGELERVEVLDRRQPESPLEVYTSNRSAGESNEVTWRDYQGYARYAFISGPGESITVLDSMQDFERLIDETVNRAGLTKTP